jgi:hypothetical protein
VTGSLFALPINDIRTESFAGRAVRVDTVQVVKIQLDIGWQVAEDLVGFRYEVRALFFDAPPEDPGTPPPDGTEMGGVDGSVIIEYRVLPGLPPPTDGDFQHFIVTKCIPDVAPYLRELIAVSATRLGYGNVSARTIEIPHQNGALS